MKFHITIDVDDRAPNEEYCGKNCKGLSKDICRFFNTKLDSFRENKISDLENDTILYEKTQEIHSWKRCKQCIELTYSFGHTTND